MMSDPNETLTEDEARRLWQKAAQLQAEAARRAEALSAGSDAADGGDEEASSRADGYALAHVRAAALEAGIGPEYVDAALADVRAERALSGGREAPKRLVARWIMGSPPGEVTARRVVRASPTEVLSAMEETLPGEPYTLLLRERIGDPAAGGTLVFDIQGVGFTTYTPGSNFKGDATFADLRQVLVTLVPLPGEPPRTEVTVRSPVAWAVGINAALSGGLSVAGGVLGLGAGVAAATGLLALGPVGAGILAAVGGGGGWAASLAGFRKLHRYGLDRGTRALEGLLAAVSAKAEGGWGIAPPRT